jgi:hypothetical protein
MPGFLGVPGDLLTAGLFGQTERPSLLLLGPVRTTGTIATPYCGCRDHFGDLDNHSVIKMVAVVP